jgi:hypothetical protein
VASSAGIPRNPRVSGHRSTSRDLEKSLLRRGYTRLPPTFLVMKGSGVRVPASASGFPGISCFPVRTSRAWGKKLGKKPGTRRAFRFRFVALSSMVAVARNDEAGTPPLTPAARLSRLA